MTIDKKREDERRFIEELERERQEKGSLVPAEDAEVVDLQMTEKTMMVFTVRLPRKTMETLARAARANGSKPGTLARELIERGLEAQESNEMKDRLDTLEKTVAELVREKGD